MGRPFPSGSVGPRRFGALIFLALILVCCVACVPLPADEVSAQVTHTLAMPYVTRQETYLQPLERFGLGVVRGWDKLDDYPLDRLPFGWGSDWTYGPPQPERPGKGFMPIIAVRPSRYPPDWENLRRAIVAQAGRGTIWLVGNEPECIYQGNRTPEEYAAIYHDCYAFLKEHDPTAQVAIGGVVQPTPLRLQWLDRALDHYQAAYGRPMPVDIWNLHIQLLQEFRGRSGADIPVGLDADEGVRTPWWENANVALFIDYVWAFRRWLAERGQRQRPLILSEYGVLMPSAWFDALGGPSGDQRVCTFMTETFDFLRTAADPDLGYSPDGNRLVQRWLWFSLDSPNRSQSLEAGYNGSLCDNQTHQITVFGQHYEAYLTDLLAN